MDSNKVPTPDNVSNNAPTKIMIQAMLSAPQTHSKSLPDCIIPLALNESPVLNSAPAPNNMNHVPALNNTSTPKMALSWTTCTMLLP